MSRIELKRTLVKKPSPTIFLRNEFSIRPGLEARFFEGQRELLKNAHPRMRLVAAFGAERLHPDQPAPCPPVPMFHIWEMASWNTLYDIMTDFSEMEWYVREIESLQREHQDLSVLAAPGIERTARPAWGKPDDPEYAYVYEEVRLRGKTTRQFLKDLNWISLQGKTRGCELTWLTQEVTGTPSQICVLWRVRSFDVFKKFLHTMTHGAPFAARYAKSMLGLDGFSRRYMYPEATEVIDDRLHNRAKRKFLGRF